MLPPVTACPPKRLRPSRWPCESRPFVDDPPPFLCAMRSSKKLARRGARYEICPGRIALRKLNVHFHGRQTLPVASLNLVLPARLVLERFELGAAQMLHDLAGHFGFRRGGAQNLFVVGADGDDVVKRHLAADLALETLDLDRLARRDPILLSPRANNGVHAASQPYRQTPIVSGASGLRQRRVRGPEVVELASAAASDNHIGV